MTTVREAVTNFVGWLGDTPAAWQSIEVRGTALFFEHSFHNAITRIRLNPDPDPALQVEFLAHTRSLVAFRAFAPMKSLDDLLTHLAAGYLQFPTMRVACVADMGGGTRGPYAYAIARAAGLPGDSSSEPFGRAHVLRLSGETMQFALSSMLGGREAIDAELQAAEIPWGGVDDLVDHLVGPQLRIDYGSQAVVEILAPLAARIDPTRCVLSRGKLTASIATANAGLTEQCSVGITTRTDSGDIGTRTRASIQRPDWTAEGHLQRASKDLVVSDDASQASIFLRVGDKYVIDRAVVRDFARPSPNLRMQAYAVVDPEMVLFLERLFELKAKEKAPGFERAIARLFMFAGFLVDSFAGDQRQTDGPDVFAYVPGQAISLVIECTLGPLAGAGGKQSKLMARAGAHAAALDVGGSRQEVIPVLVTALPLDQVALADRQEADTNGIVILAREDLEGLLALVRQQSTPDATLDFVRSRIPRQRDRGAGSQRQLFSQA
jgi:hypothetical protein